MSVFRRVFSPVNNVETNEFPLGDCSVVKVRIQDAISEHSTCGTYSTTLCRRETGLMG